MGLHEKEPLLGMREAKSKTANWTGRTQRARREAAERLSVGAVTAAEVDRQPCWSSDIRLLQKDQQRSGGVVSAHYYFSCLRSVPHLQYLMNILGCVFKFY